MSDPFSDEIASWKSYYLTMGLPETLLDSMIAEAEAEWDEIIGFSNYKTFGDLTVNITDANHGEDQAYFISVIIDNRVFCGIITELLSYTFNQVPCASLIVEVFKLATMPDPYGEAEILNYGFGALNHSGSESLGIILTSIDYLDQFEFKAFVSVDFTLSEQMIIAEGSPYDEAISKVETFTITNS